MREDDLRKIKRLFIAQLLTAIVAIGALVVAVASFDAKAAAIQTSRRNAREDNCYLLRGLAVAAAPDNQLAEVHAYFHKTPLHNCDAYARSLK